MKEFVLPPRFTFNTQRSLSTYSSCCLGSNDSGGACLSSCQCWKTNNCVCGCGCVVEERLYHNILFLFYSHLQNIRTDGGMGE